MISIDGWDATSDLYRAGIACRVSEPPKKGAAS